MGNKTLILLLVVMIIITGGIGYLAYDAYEGYADRDLTTESSKQELAEEIVEEEKEIEKEGDIKNDKDEAADSTSQDAKNYSETLNEKITVILDHAEPMYPDYDVDRYGYEMHLSMTFLNNTDKEVRGFSGTIYFYDIFDDLIHSVNLKYDDEVIMSNGMMYWVGVLDINRFMDDHMRLFNTPFENINFKYNIDKIIFTDGTSL